MNQGLDADLERYVHDSTVAAALRSWASGFGGTIRVPAQPRRARGYTEAFLFTITLDRPRESGRTRSEKLFVKVLPARPDATESLRHELAWSSAPEFANRHLVRQPYHWYPVGDGRHLMFQSVANGGDPVSTLTELLADDKALVRAFRAVAASLLSDWNGGGKRHAGMGPSTNHTTVHQYLSGELAATGALPAARAQLARLELPSSPDGDWVFLDGRMLPNPLRFADEGSAFAGHSLDYLCGFSHGDLHGGNILVPVPSNGMFRPSRFRLVDLSSYEEDAPLSRDLLCLLVTTVLHWVAPPLSEDGTSHPGLPPDQAEALLHHLVTPEATPSTRLLPVLADLVGIVNTAGLNYAERESWRPEWRSQQRLSLIGQALTCMTFDNIDHAGRRWCFRLAAHAAEAHRREHHASTAPPPELMAGPPRQATAGSFTMGWYQQDAGPATPAWQGQTDASWPQLIVSNQSHRHTGADGPQSGSRFVPLTQPGRPQSGSAFGARDAVPPLRRNNAAPTASRSPEPGSTAPPAPGTEGRPGDSSPTSRSSRLNRWRNLRLFPPTIRADSTMRARLTSSMVAVLSTSLVLLLPGDTVESARIGPTTNRWPGEEIGRVGRGTPRETPPYRDDATITTLRRLAEAVRDLPEPATQGRYAHVCLQLWSPEDLAAGSDDLGRYQEEQLWWTPQRSGRGSVTRFEDGRRTGGPDVTRYGVGDLTEAPPAPADELATLRQQIAMLRDAQPLELRNAAGTLWLVAQFHRFWPPTPRQRAALLQLVIETPGVSYQGKYPDRANRLGYAVSADGVNGRRETLTFEPGTGRLLSHETTGANETLLSYYLFLDATWTETMTDLRCAASRSPYGQ